MKVLRRWRISARDAKSRRVPSPDPINWLEKGGRRKKKSLSSLPNPRNSESVRQSSSNISPNISGLSKATTILSPSMIFRIQAGYLDSLPDRLGRDSVADTAISHLPSPLPKLNDSRNVFLGLSTWDDRYFRMHSVVTLARKILLSEESWKNRVCVYIYYVEYIFEI